MAAAEAVFDTYELIESIIAFLPRQDIRKGQSVCSVWRKLISESKVIRRARCLPVETLAVWHSTSRWDPSNGDDNGVQLLADDEFRDPGVRGARYYMRMFFRARLNPIVYGNRTQMPGCMFHTQVTHLLDINLDDVGEQHVSEPPVSIMYIEVEDDIRRTSEHVRTGPRVPTLQLQCSAQKDTGITIRDVVDCARLMIATDAPRTQKRSLKVYIGSFRKLVYD